MTTVGAYLRVSSKGQRLETQCDAVSRAAKARGLRVAVWYREKLGGAAADRPELERLRADARAGKLTHLIVYRLDRLTRRGIRDTLALLDELQHCGVQVETIADGFSLAGPARDVVVAVLAWAAQMERAAIGERISAARKRVEASGGAWGRPRRCDELTQARIRKLDKEGRSVRAIAIACKVPRGTVANVLAKKGVYSQASAAGKKQGPSKVAGGRPN